MQETWVWSLVGELRSHMAWGNKDLGPKSLSLRTLELVCLNNPGLSHSGSGSQVLHKGTDSGGPVFSALPRSKQLRWPGVWWVHTLQVGWCILSPPLSQPFSFLGAQQERHLRCDLSVFWGADLWLWPSWWMSTIQDPRKTWLATGSLLGVW